MKKLWCIAVGMLGLVPLQGCMATTGEEGTEQTGSAAEAVTSCNSTNGLMPTKAALAVAMGDELGRWEPLKDLAVSNGIVVLSSTAVCLKNNCAATKAILGQQNMNLTSVIDQSIFNPGNYISDMNNSFSRQVNLMDSLRQNSPTKLPPAHKLTMVHGPVDLGTGACGAHFVFQADHLDGTALSTTEAQNLANDLCYYSYGTCGQNAFIAYAVTTQGCPSGRTCVAVDPNAGDSTGTTTTSASAPPYPSFPMNRLLDTSCSATGCTSATTMLGQHCYLYGTTTVGTMTNKCAMGAAYASTCGYLYCVKDM